MEGNPNDNALREKLGSAEYPFEPGAWAQMEAMLDSKKKRRGIFWWSALGIAASLLLLNAGVYVALHRHIDTLKNERVAHKRDPSTINSQQSSNSQQAINNGALVSGNEQNTTNSNQQINNIAFSKQETPKGEQASTPTPYQHTQTTQGNKKHATGKDSSKDKPLYHYDPIYPQTASILHTESTPRPTLTFTELELAPSLLHSVNYNCFYDSSEEPVATIPAKLKRKISIQYKLSVESDIYEGFAKKTLASLPTWGVGISEELMIGKYFGITNGILYSEVNFRINNPKYPDNNYSSLDYYSSHIREVAIPIGVKVYPYSTPKVKLSIGIAYVNHIKLQETFSYSRTATKQPSTFADANTYFPANNPFIPQSNPALSAAAPPPVNSVLADYYSLGNAHRYYGSIAYTVGAEVSLSRHFKLSAEPCFRMSLDKIKMQNSRVFDFGLNTGVKYAF